MKILSGNQVFWATTGAAALLAIAGPAKADDTTPTSPAAPATTDSTAAAAAPAGSSAATTTPAPATDAAAPTATGTNAASATAAVPVLNYGVPEIVQLAQAQVSDSTIITYVRNSGNSYGLDASQIVYLRQQGVSEAVIDAMLTQPKSGAAPVYSAPMVVAPDNSQIAAAAPPVAPDPGPAAVADAPPASSVYVIPDSATYNYDANFYGAYPPAYYPYYPYYPYYGGVVYSPVVYIGGGYRGGGWHGAPAGGFHGGGHPIGGHPGGGWHH